ncbi:hypothetical protein NQ315_006162 [Exocentrus adspersus]|uniref:RRM domain-containing protein n=1 Tax=Exocentrus adspersus TaxID=1586481 RepID=A0AAV8VZ87_9CUCU|nr:hypothetical protein NQ315_006162 [Exocentrus adspersus]
MVILQEVKTYSESPTNCLRRRSDLSKKLWVFAQKNGYQIIQTNGQRVYEPSASKNVKPPPRGCEIFIGKLHKNLYEDELIPLFETIGPLYKFRLMLDFREQTRGYAFATYFCRAHAEQAVRQLDGYQIRNGLKIGVFMSVDNRRLYLGNLPTSVTRLELKETLYRYVDGITDIIMYSDYVRPELNRGFAFVEFENHRLAAMARRQFAPENLVVWGQPLYVDWADPLPEVHPDIMAKVSVLYMKNIPIEYSSEQVHAILRDIVGTHLLRKVHKIQNFAFIHFINRRSAEFALHKLADLVMVGKLGQHYIRLEWARPRRFSKQWRYNSPPQNFCTLFIGGIPTYKRKDEVWQELCSQGVKNIVDVIMYRSYSNRAENRGFVFVEFKTHEEAAYFRAKFGKKLKLWNISVVVDWSIPVPQVDECIMNQVKIIYLRNLDVCETREQVQATVLQFTSKSTIEKVYKFKNYAFIHVVTREYAEHLLQCLQSYYKERDPLVEVKWAQPSSKYTTQDYRHQKVSVCPDLLENRNISEDDLAVVPRNIGINSIHDLLFLHLLQHRMVCSKGDFTTNYVTAQVNGQLISTLKINCRPKRGTEIFIKRIPRDALLQDVLELVITCGDVYQVRLLMDFSGYNRGYCFVTYLEMNSARKAVVALNGSEIKSSKIVVKLSFDNNKLEMRGIPFKISREDVFRTMIGIIGTGLRQVITFRSNNDNATNNNGRVCVLKYDTHRNALEARRKVWPRLTLWNRQIEIDWAIPHEILNSKRLYFRNIPAGTTKLQIYEELTKYINIETLLNMFLQEELGYFLFTSESTAYNAFVKLRDIRICGRVLEFSFSRFVAKYVYLLGLLL